MVMDPSLMLAALLISSDRGGLAWPEKTQMV
jgi:hypothetical protein